MPGTFCMTPEILSGDAGELVEVVAEELEGVFAFDAGHGFFDVVLNILREVEVDAGVLIEAFGDGGDQLIFIAVELQDAIRGGLEVGEKFDVVEGADVGAVVGAAHLRDDLRDFRIGAEGGTNVVGQFLRGLEGDVLLHVGADPEIAFFEGGHEFAADEVEENAGSDEGKDGDDPGEAGETEGAAEAAVVVAAEEVR